MGDGFDRATIETRIRGYESFGMHRTGWPGDDETSRWLVSELAGSGIEGSTERFSFPRFECRSARLRWPDGEAEGVPLYDGGVTSPRGLQGPLVAPDGDDLVGSIVVDSQPGPPGDPALYERAQRLRQDGALGLVLVSADEDGAVVLRNAERIDRPLDLPVLQLARADADGLASAVLLGAEGTIEVDGERLRSTATNVVATLAGEDPDAAPVGVVTPKSGWFTCAAERGGGIAIWLALAEALSTLPGRRRTVQMVASSGHELRHYGLRAYLEARPSLAAGAVAWLHLGASIGARRARARMVASDDALHAIAVAALKEAGAGPREPLPLGTAAGGEAREIAEGGGRWVSLLGGHPLFHSPNDLYDRAVDAESVASHARAALAIVEGMLAL